MKIPKAILLVCLAGFTLVDALFRKAIALLRKVIWLVVLAGLTLGLVVYLNLDAVVKTAIEQTLTRSLAVPTTLTKVIFKPGDGYLELNGLVIANPSGFSAPQFLQVQNFTVQLQPQTLLFNRIEIEKFELKGVSIDIEQQFLRNNILEIFTSAEDYKQGGQPGQIGQEKKFNLRSATIDNVSVNLRLVQFGIVLRSFSATLPKVDLQNLNSENYQGLLMSEVFTKLVSSTLKDVVEQNKASIPPQILDILKQQKLIS